MRYPSIDILRTVAVVVMVQVHFVQNLSGLHHPTPAGFGAPLFALLLGISYHLWLNGQRMRDAEDSAISKISIRRGLFLFGTGILFNVFVWLPEDTFIWDILTFLGVGLIFLNGARKLPESVLLTICAVVFVASPMLRVITDYPAYWTTNTFDFDLTLSDVLLGFLVNGHFPIFPWILYPIMGYVIAARMLPPGGACAPKTLDRLTLVGIGLLGAWLAARSLRLGLPPGVRNVFLEGWTMFPATVEYVLATLGMAVTALALLHRFADVPGAISKDSALARIFSTFGPRALTVYVLHHMAHIWPLWIYGLVMRDEPTAYWRKALPFSLAWPLAFVFLVLCYFLLRWMERRGNRGMEGLMRWICD